MRDIFPKFIIEDNCTFHKEIATDITKVKSGGWFRYDRDTNTFTLYGSSDDFGTASFEDIKEIVNNKKIYNGVMAEYRNISEKHTFAYDIGSEIIILN